MAVSTSARSRSRSITRCRCCRSDTLRYCSSRLQASGAARSFRSRRDAASRPAGDLTVGLAVDRLAASVTAAPRPGLDANCRCATRGSRGGGGGRRHAAGLGWGGAPRRRATAERLAERLEAGRLVDREHQDDAIQRSVGRGKELLCARLHEVGEALHEPSLQRADERRRDDRRQLLEYRRQQQSGALRRDARCAAVAHAGRAVCSEAGCRAAGGSWQ